MSLSAATDLGMQLSVGKTGGGEVTRWRYSWDGEEEDGSGEVCVGWVKGRWGHRQLTTTDLSKPTYLDSVIASL